MNITTQNAFLWLIVAGEYFLIFPLEIRTFIKFQIFWSWFLGDSWFQFCPSRSAQHHPTLLNFGFLKVSQVSSKDYMKMSSSAVFNYDIFRYWAARNSCPKCSYSWTNDLRSSVMNLRKVKTLCIIEFLVFLARTDFLSNPKSNLMVKPCLYKLTLNGFIESGYKNIIC